MVSVERPAAVRVIIIVYYNIFYFWSVAKSATGLLSTRLRARSRAPPSQTAFVYYYYYYYYYYIHRADDRSVPTSWHGRGVCVCECVCDRELEIIIMYNIRYILYYYCIRARFAIDFGRQIQFLEPDPFPKISRALASPRPRPCLRAEDENYSWTVFWRLINEFHLRTHARTHTHTHNLAGNVTLYTYIMRVCVCPI